jgi:hypothetical protein
MPVGDKASDGALGGLRGPHAPAAEKGSLGRGDTQW